MPEYTADIVKFLYVLGETWKHHELQNLSPAVTTSFGVVFTVFVACLAFTERQRDFPVPVAKSQKTSCA